MMSSEFFRQCQQTFHAVVCLRTVGETFFIYLFRDAKHISDRVNGYMLTEEGEKDFRKAIAVPGVVAVPATDTEDMATYFIRGHFAVTALSSCN